MQTRPSTAAPTEVPATRGRVPGYTGLRELGRGRSGVVYAGRDAAGRELACKVFGADGVTKLVQFVLLGAPNPYLWNEDAVRCAYLRRRIVARLVPLWFGERLAVADAVDTTWNEDERAFQLDAELSPGSAPPLHHPLRTRGEGLVHELIHEVMAPLAERLTDAGLDGLVWQAGKGNPVALNNFLLERAGEEHRWRWIDLESGVPALFPLDPRALLGFYLPRSFRYRRPLFDDVDARRLEETLEREGEALAALHGADVLAELHEAARELGERQARWKDLPRHHRSIGYRLARGDVDEAQAEHFRTRPLRWYARESVRALRAAWRHARALPAWLGALVSRVPWNRLPELAWRFLTSGRFRKRQARHFVARRLRAWERRGQLERSEVRRLRARLATEESSAYLTDFGVHLALKPPVKAIEYWVLPALWGLGWISSGTLALALVSCGAAARTLYTAGRFVQSLRRGRELPWVALGVGVLPVFGNFAYPLQILYSSTEEKDDLARFILYDGCTRLGRHVPIWGGADTRTEHAFNRLPDRLANLRKKPPREAIATR